MFLEGHLLYDSLMPLLSMIFTFFQYGFSSLRAQGADPIPFTDLTSRKVRTAVVIGRRGVDLFLVPISSQRQNTACALLGQARCRIVEANGWSRVSS
jgi:hypothetical protein